MSTPLRSFQQGMQWRCQACFRDRHDLVAMGPKECPKCGCEREEWALSFPDALRIALKKAYTKEVIVEDGCHLCSGFRPQSLTLCMSCGKQSCWCWEVEVLHYFEGDPVVLSSLRLDDKTLKLIADNNLQ